MYYFDNKLRVFKMLKKLMEAEENKDPAATAEETPPAEAPEETPTEEAPAEEAPPAEAPETPAEETATEETPPEEAPEEAPTEETGESAEAAEEPEVDPAQEAAKKIEDMAKKNVVDDYDLVKQLKFSYQPILNADTLREKTGAIRTYQKVIDNLVDKSEENEKIKAALAKTRDFIRADSRYLAAKLFRKLNK